MGLDPYVIAACIVCLIVGWAFGRVVRDDEPEAPPEKPDWYKDSWG